MGTEQSRHVRIRDGKAYQAGQGTTKDNNSNKNGPLKMLHTNSLNGVAEAGHAYHEANRPLTEFEVDGEHKTKAKFFEAVGLIRSKVEEPEILAYLQEVEKDLDENKNLFKHKNNLSAISDALGYHVLSKSISEI